jgi:hypothetical protein
LKSKEKENEKEKNCWEARLDAKNVVCWVIGRIVAQQMALGKVLKCALYLSITNFLHKLTNVLFTGK